MHVEKLVFRLENWLDWEFDVPPLPEQLRIVAMLDAWNRAVDQAERLIAANKLAYRSELDRFTRQASDNLHRLDDISRVNLCSLSSKTSPFEFDYFDIAAAEDGTEEELSGRLSFE